jgi:hypothetical protein
VAGGPRVRIHLRLITEGLDVAHLRLIIGSSMGGMHAWMWAEMYPDLMDGGERRALRPSPASLRLLGVMTEVSQNPTLSENQRAFSDLHKRTFLHENAKEREIVGLGVAKMYCKSILTCKRFAQPA